ncbi:MAG: GNAT family N-acetyltransferase [Pseudomonadota bacterium]
MVDRSLQIRPFQSGDAEHFARLNRRWIEEFFGMESEDAKVLSAPEAEILDPGGYIAIADLEGEIVGTGALNVPEKPSKWLELVKMATDPEAQGKGVGSAVLDHLIGVARERGAQAIWLETNDKLGAATRLYARKGFRPLSKEEEHPTPYSRCNLQMVLTL